jgi:hypothetical protein
MPCHLSNLFGNVSSWRAISSRLGFSSWLYQLEEYVRLGVDDRLLVDERLGGRELADGRIVELEDERLRGGVEVVIDAIG